MSSAPRPAIRISRAEEQASRLRSALPYLRIARTLPRTLSRPLVDPAETAELDRKRVAARDYIAKRGLRPGCSGTRRYSSSASSSRA